MDSSNTQLRIEINGTVLDVSLVSPALPVSHRPPPLPAQEPKGLESIWPMELLVGLRERLTRKEHVWERTTRWRVA